MTTPKSATPFPEALPMSAPPDATASRTSRGAPYVPEKRTPNLSLRDNARVLVMGVGVVLILLLLALNGITHKSRAVTKSRVSNGQQGSDVAASQSATPASVTPIMEIGASPREDDARAMRVNALQIDQTASRKPSPVSAPQLNLASVPRLEDRSWQPPPYPGNARNLATSEAPASKPENKQEPKFADRDSLVFINKTSASVPRREPETLAPAQEQIGLPAGSRLRAKLVSAINSAVQAPIVAVIEYNYERNGEIVVPAGARATGKLLSADRSGTVEIRFESLLFPHAAPVAFDAVATDLQLRPLRGHVEGTNTGRNFLVRSAAGIGEVASTLVGRGSLNRPFSEDDLLRERLSTNIGQAADQQISSSALGSRLVVSLEAGTEIYLVLEKASPEHRQSVPQQTNSSRQSLDELRQLLELQRELNAAATQSQ